MSKQHSTQQPSPRHPKGLYVLFATELWERFSFYSMLALFTLYLRDDTGQGFAWTAEQATRLYANYLMFVYASPLVGGWIADRKLGYRRAVMLGGLFFIAGHFLLSFHSMVAVYAALTCLVIGNGFFKPNVSTMVGNLYPAGSPLRDQAYNIFYLGINVGAFTAPLLMELIKSHYGYHPAFAAAAVGMVFSVAILHYFRHHTEPGGQEGAAPAGEVSSISTVSSTSRDRAIDQVPERHRIAALCVIYAIVIVFWMVFQQNGSTLTYWADENTDWQVSGVISNAINPFWILTLTFPLVWFWGWLGRRGLEPSTPAKMAIGMTLTGLSFFVLYAAAKLGEATTTAENPYDFVVSPWWLIAAYGVVTLGELMLSPMGLSLVSKVAPKRLRGLMMGGWFLATAIGNKLTMIGIFWDRWLHSTFFAVLGTAALFMAVVLTLLLKPLRKAMPGC